MRVGHTGDSSVGQLERLGDAFQADLLGLPRDSDGTWSVTEAGKNELNITFGTDQKKLTGKVLFRDKNEFALKFDQPVVGTPPPASPPPKGDAKDQSDTKDQPKETPKEQSKSVASIVFKRSTQ